MFKLLHFVVLGLGKMPRDSSTMVLQDVKCRVCQVRPKPKIYISQDGNARLAFIKFKDTLVFRVKIFMRDF